MIWLDPRAPHQVEGPARLDRASVQGELVVHLGQGFQIGGNWRWNSGTVASRTFRASGRNLPLRVATGEEFEYAASRGAGSRRRLWARWATRPSASSTSGCCTTTASPAPGLELFADIFNLFDNQDATRNQDLLAGAGGIDFGDGIRFTSPRRVFLGLRLNF